MKEDFLNFDPVTAAAIITGIGNTAVGIYDSKKKRELDEFLAKQNAATQRRIAEDFAKAKTEQDKIRFIQELEKKQRRQKYMPYYIAGGILAVGVTIAVVLILRKKK
jgi:hypothetical protein